MFGLADIFIGGLEIEKTARRELYKVSQADFSLKRSALPTPILSAMQKYDAHPICKDIIKMSFNWCPPETSKNPLYVKHSVFKSHVELVGPDGLVKSEVVRVGLYGMLPNCEYGVRTHPAEEIYIMLAGECFWKRGDASYVSERQMDGLITHLLCHTLQRRKIKHLCQFMLGLAISRQRHINILD